MQDIADRIGVSKALVSLVIRNAPGPSAETRQRVLAAADELGYRVNRAAALMTAKRSHPIGGNGRHSQQLSRRSRRGRRVAADAVGYEVVLGAVTPTHCEPNVIDTLLDFRCEGFS